MKFGYFDDANREYVITTPRTPLPWINYLGNQDFFTLISNTAGGYSFYKDARLLRMTRYRYNDVPYDGNGKYIYIKDGEQVWNTAWQPSKTELDSYTCRHGMGYTRFHSSKDGITADQLNFVPMGDTCEIMLLDLKNDSDAVKEIKVFPYVEWCLWDADDDQKNFQRNLSTCIGEVFPARVSSLTSFGLFAELDNTCEGMIPLHDLPGVYIYNELDMALVGGKITFRLGDRLTVRVEEVDPLAGRVRFSLV